jgi:hypothetical protein
MARFSSQRLAVKATPFGVLPLWDIRLETYPSTSLPNQYFHAMHGDAGRAAAVHEVGFEVRDWALSCGVI